MMESRAGQLLPINAPKDSQSAIIAEQQQKRILDKVWATVEKAMGEMRTLLVSQLQQPGRPTEDQEKTIEILLELNMPEDPVWTYFDAQHKFILDQMNKSYHAALAVVQREQDAKEVSSQQSGSLKSLLASKLGTCITALKAGKQDQVIPQSGGHEVWMAVYDLVKNISEIMTSALPNFWKIARGFLDGKYRRNTSANILRRNPSQVRTMAHDIIKLYVSLLSEFFVFSDIAVATLPPQEGEPASLLPDGSNSLTTAHYLMKILTEIQDNVNEINSMEISGEMSSSLKGLLDSAKWGFERVLMQAWIRDAQSFHYLETWALSSSEPYTTEILSDFQFFQKQVSTWAFKFASGAEVSSSSRLARRPISSEFVMRIMKAFLDATYAFLDGLVYLAAEGSPATDVEKTPRVDVSTTGKIQALGLLDTSNVDTRALLAISNFVYLERGLIPSMMAQFEAAANIAIETEKTTLMAVVEQLDRTLFEKFLEPKVTIATGKLRGGILDPEMDWYETPQPTEIRPYIFETLMYLVGVHAQVSEVAPPLLDRVLNALVESLVEEALRCFKQVKRFGMGGMLRATLEIEFMHQTLSRYVTTNTAKMLSDLYTKISQAYARRPGDENLQGNLDGVKRTLSDTRRRTGIEFLCFRATKEKGAGAEKGEKAERRDKKEKERGARSSGNAREPRAS